MKVHIPGKVAFLETHYRAPDGTLHDVPIVTEYGYESWKDVPNVFLETKGRRFNNVVHAKPSGNHGEEMVIPDMVVRDNRGNEIVCHSAIYGRDIVGENYGSYLYKRISHDGHSIVTVDVNQTQVYGHFGVFFYPEQICIYTASTSSVIRGCACRCTPNADGSLRGSWNWFDQGPYPDIFDPTDWFASLLRDCVISRPLGPRQGGWYPYTAREFDYIAVKAADIVLSRILPIILDHRDFAMAMAVFHPAILTDVTVVDTPAFLPNDFVFDEYNRFIGGDQLVRASAFYWQKWLFQHAYVDACDSLPRLNDNSISNILEIASFIVELVVHHRVSIPRSLTDAWLSYRYQYMTTKLDVQEAINFVHRNIELPDIENGITVHGSAIREIDGVTVNCLVTVGLIPRELSTLVKVWHALYEYGLQPNFYVLWDSLPYSFIVDWFLPLGDVAHVADVKANFSEGVYDVSKCIVSYEYTKTSASDAPYHCYSRWVTSPPDLQGFYWFDAADPVTGKVKMFRVLDIMSLVLGRRK